jgi:beta-N-acetylhexosaminidase
MVKTRTRYLYIVLAVVLAFSFLPAAQAQQDPAVTLLQEMSPAERVGQLFIITFDGSNLDPDDPAYELIVNHHISGVLLTRENNNVVEAPESIENLQNLILSLQELKHNASSLDVTPDPSSYIPLFIGIEQEGAQQGEQTIIEGRSATATNMAIGATWDANIAYQAGEIVGRELEAIGFNLMIGPSLDVLEDPQISGTSDLGIRTFGGDPYWVSVMGEAYIQGIHASTGRRMAVFPTHFPGLGSSDRPIGFEVPTIRKTLEDLQLLDLAPFFAVTSLSDGDTKALADGLLTAHIRYQGLQGNIRATSRPVSLDPQAFSLVMSLEPIQTWRALGGVTMSDSLGSRAIRYFRDPSGETFSAHLVARDAFLAGNDLLLLDDFQDSGDPDEFTTIVSTIEFFEGKYAEDPIFAQKVDEAVVRIIRLKLGLYGGTFSYSRVLQAKNDLEQIASERQITSQISTSSATLLSPTQNEVDDRVGGIPKIGERIVFLTDVRYSRQCSTCDYQALIEVDALERAILRQYGPGAAGQVGGWNLRSYSFADLANYLGERPAEPPLIPVVSPEEVDEAIRQADWLVFNMMDSRANTYGASALKSFLDLRPDLALEKRVVVFAYDVPYGLDATEISKIDLYYALFDSSQAFVDTAAKLLFQEQTADGASPVNVPGIGYELIEVTAPEPDQVISLHLAPDPSEESESAEPLGFLIGDTVTIQTGVIVDGNGNPVPDRTPVEFSIRSGVEGVASTIVSTTTEEGIATLNYTLEQTGLIAISAQAGGARISETVQIDAKSDAPAQATVISPTPLPTITSEPTTTPDLTTPTPFGESEQEEGAIEGTFSSRLGALVMGLFAAAVVSYVGYFTANREQLLNEHILRYTLVPAIAGLLAYNYLALGLPGSQIFTTGLGGVGVFAVVTVGGGIGLFGAHFWYRMVNQRRS